MKNLNHPFIARWYKVECKYESVRFCLNESYLAAEELSRTQQEYSSLLSYVLGEISLPT